MARDRQIALLFPGQGSQTADMRETVERRRPDLLELALEEVGPDLFERAADGTRWAQPAIYCAAAGAELRRAGRGPRADVMAGHSLGEITALVAAGALGAEDGLRLVAARGRLMQEAAEETGDGGMTAVRARDGQPRRRSPRWPPRTSVAIANDNAPDQLVLSGAVDALDRVEAELKERGVRGQAPAGGGRVPLAAHGAGRRAVPGGRGGHRVRRAERAGDVVRDGPAVRGHSRASSSARSPSRSAGSTWCARSTSAA